MRTITLEEHYATEAFMEGPGRELKAQAEAARSHPQVAAGYEKLIEQLCDLGGGRISAMDAAHIDVQVLSLTFPGVEQLDAPEAVAFARQTNDLLPGSRRRRAGAHGPRTQLQGGVDQRTLPGTLPGRLLFLANLGAGRSARGPYLPPPDADPAGGDRGILHRQLRAGDNGPALDRGLGLARGDRNPRPTAHPWRGVRQVPEPPTRGRAHG